MAPGAAGVSSYGNACVGRPSLAKAIKGNTLGGFTKTNNQLSQMSVFDFAKNRGRCGFSAAVQG